VPPNTPLEQKRQMLDAWYRDQLKEEIPVLLAKWQLRLGVEAHRFFVQRMKTKWGSCNLSAGSIRVNTGIGEEEAKAMP